MSYPVDYIKAMVEGHLTSSLDDYPAPSGSVREIQEWLAGQGLVATRIHEPLQGLIARVRIDAVGKSAAEIEATLLEYASRCDGAMEVNECSYGECVIERNLEEQWGDSYSWRGRITLHPSIGSIPKSSRAAAAVVTSDVV